MAEIEQNIEYDNSQRAFYALAEGIMGTRFEIVIFDIDQIQAKRIWQSVLQKLEGWHTMLNRFDSTSEVSRINNEKKLIIAISDELEQILLLCKKYWRQSAGIFDVTQRNFGELTIEKGYIYKAEAHTTLDFGGFAKGYALLKIKQIMEREGVRSALIDFGHSTITAIGQHPSGQSWEVALPSPFDGREVARFKLENRTLSTSGNTPSYRGHIIDPKSGERIFGRELCSIVADNPLDAEVLSTVAMIASESEFEHIKQNFVNIEAYRYEL